MLFSKSAVLPFGRITHVCALVQATLCKKRLSIHRDRHMKGARVAMEIGGSGMEGRDDASFEQRTWKCE